MIDTTEAESYAPVLTDARENMDEEKEEAEEVVGCDWCGAGTPIGNYGSMDLCIFCANSATAWGSEKHEMKMHINTMLNILLIELKK